MTFDPAIEFLLVYDKSFSCGEDGTPNALPDRLNGSSGCPVWRGEPNTQLDPASILVIGVQTTVYGTDKTYIKVIKATRWDHVLKCLGDAFL